MKEEKEGRKWNEELEDKKVKKRSGRARKKDNEREEK